MCIAHPIIDCNCEQVRLPTLGAHDAWGVMKNRFKLVHGALKAVEPCKIPPIPKSILSAPLRQGGKHVKWVVGYTGRVDGEGINPVLDRRSRKGVHRMPTPAPKPKRSPCAALPAYAVQMHPSRILPVTRSKSYNAYYPSNRVKPDPLFTQHYKNKLNSSTHTRHVRN